MASLGDKKGLEAVSEVVATVKKLSMDQVSKERRGVAVLEVMTRHPDWWKSS